jgi:hypothetical protein
MRAAMRARATGTATPTAMPMVLPELDDLLSPPPETLEEDELALEAIDEPDGEIEELLEWLMSMIDHFNRGKVYT